MPLTKVQIKNKLAVVEKKWKKRKELLAEAASEKRVLQEMWRSVLRKEARAKLTTPRTSNKKKSIRRGRPERWPGKCVACCRRKLKLKGWPRHNRKLCAMTKAWIGKQKRFK